MSWELSELVQGIAEMGPPTEAHLALASLLLALLGATARFSPGLHPRTRYTLLLLGFTTFLVPAPIVGWIAALLRIDLHRSLVGSAQLLGLVWDPLPEMGTPYLRAGTVWPCVVAGIWAAGMGASLQSLVRRARRTARTLLSHTSPARATDTAALGGAARALGAVPVALARSEACSAPVVVGILRPIILVPHGVSEFTDEELEAALTHELAHVVRRDTLTLGVIAAVRCVFWFHPLLWIAEWWAREMCEEACDAAAVSVTSASLYRSALLKTCRAVTRATPDAAIAMTGANLKRRLEALMNVNAAVGIPHRLALTSATILVVAGLSAAAAATEGSAGKSTMTVGEATIAYACSRPVDEQGTPAPGRVECAMEVSKAGSVQTRPVITMLLGEEEAGTIRTSWKDQDGTLHEVRVAIQFASTESGTARVEVLRGGKVEESQVGILHVAPRP